MFVPISKNKVYNWQEYTLLVPVVSVGNIGQLTTDLVISTLCMDRIGYILHDAITPAVGNNPFAHADADKATCELTTCVEVYESVTAQIMAIQQRAPLIKGRVKSYIKFLSEWIKEKNFYQVVIVGSTFAHERLDYQMEGSPFRMVITDKLRERSGALLSTKLNWKEMEPRQNVITGGEHGEGDSRGNSITASLFLPGSGIAKPLLEALQDLPVLLFVLFCSEGDNAQDAICVAQELNGWMNMIGNKEESRVISSNSSEVARGIVDWKIPTSWRHFYGTKFDQTLFH